MKHPPNPYNDPTYRAARKHLTHNPTTCTNPECTNPATTIDHQPPISLHNHQRGTNCCTLHPVCAHCNYSHGATIGNKNREPHTPW